ncbi:RNA-binding protein [Pollutibacter soli]|uniref:RNA recognition motif domain-containing protein n=1 Tax=Pollutibacter soli TaxID=3034157 RepID=UPI003013B353
MNLYVSNLGFGTQDNDLQKLFAEYGNVTSAKVILDKFTGKSRGFGFVEMPDKESAENAIKEIDGKTVDGRQVRVSEARPKEDNRNSRGGGFNKRW